MKYLITGGAGYIGSHTVLELLNAGHECVVVDSLINSFDESLKRVETLTGKQVEFHQVDLLDKPALEAVFAKHTFDAVVHFAALKAVGESVAKPLTYYHNNITGTLVLCEVMKAAGCKNIVFSSSATVYGDPATVPITEDFPTGATNPYGRTKLFMEDILVDLHTADADWNVVLLRYFNPVGAHASGQIGEHPQGIPNNLTPYITQTAIGLREKLSVFGGDWPTPDGTGVRDYIHVVDLALGHLAALKKLTERPGVKIYNLGTGKGFSVLDMIKAFEKAIGKPVAYQIVDRRVGDVASVYATTDLAREELGWVATRGIDEMCEDAWRWQSMNPKGFEN
ncbi:MAG: UDP-glucose 4-epimerase GalE [Phycisphaerales bacterium]|mgnify:CR=1 FL=1|jgi:UDP-glucose 4-epimerase|nr:UDP-glucose 4-epimerase GalE [Phycisphaerales bacterium]